MTTTYHTHDNGGRPFKVIVNEDEKIVLIYHQDSDKIAENGWTSSIYFDEPIYDSHYNNIFIGKSPKNKMTKFSGSYGTSYDGNSILLEITPLKYVYIGQCISKFETNSKIVEYISSVGNNNIPYPYAIDEEGYNYLILENVKVKLPPTMLNNYDDPYSYFYKYDLITSNKGYIPAKQPIMLHFKNIKKYFIGKKPYTLRYVSDPAKNYDRISKWDDFGDGMKLILTNGNQKKINKQQYIDLMNEYGSHYGFKYFDTNIVIPRP
jgi:hypothetical protein